MMPHYLVSSTVPQKLIITVCSYVFAYCLTIIDGCIFPDAVMAASVEINENGVDQCAQYEDINLKQIANATAPETKLKLLIMIEDILPKLSLDASTAAPIDLVPTVISNSSTHVSEDLRDIYTTIVKHIGLTANEAGYKRFLEAVNEVSVAKTEACNSKSPDSSNKSQLLQEFVAAYQLEDESSLHSVRSLFGKLLCLNSASVEQSRFRKETDSLDVDSGKCECPPGGINGTDWSKFESCNFYACLTAGQIYQRIFFTHEYKADYQCLAFIIDTTGSMGEEVSTAKRVILDFVRSEQEIGSDGCYILVPFNDVGPDDEIVAEKSKLIEVIATCTIIIVIPWHPILIDSSQQGLYSVVNL